MSKVMGIFGEILALYHTHSPNMVMLRDPSGRFRKFLFCLNSTFNIMLLLTNCEVHTGKYSDRSYEVRTERSEVRTKN